MNFKALPVVRTNGTNDASGQIEAYAAVFAEPDPTGEVMQPGAFSRTLHEAHATRRASGLRFLWPLLWQNDPKQPVGGVLEAQEDGRGLKVTALVDVDTRLGAQTYSGLKKGYIRQLALGYEVQRAARGTGGVRSVLEAKIWSVGLLPMGMAASEGASVLSVKSRLDDRMDRLGRALDDWRRQRPPLAPPTGSGAAPRWHRPAPDRSDFQYSDLYQAAFEKWWAGEQALFAREGQPDPFASAVTAERDRRVASGQATLDEVRAWSAAHGGVTPAGTRIDEAELARQADFRARAWAELGSGKTKREE